MSIVTKNPQNLLIATAVVLVVVLGVLLVSNATSGPSAVSTGATGSGTETDGQTADENAAWFASRSSAVQLGGDDDGVYADCDLPAKANDPLLVVAYNASPDTLDYTIQVQLTDSDGSKATGQADFTALRGGETRYVVPSWTSPLVAITRCTVETIETDRRLIVRNAPASASP